MTTQYLEEADALSDRIIVIDHGTIIAEGTADELKERTGATYCEIVPRHLKDLPAMAEALGSLLPEKNRAALTPASDRIAMPAPDGPNTLVQALPQLERGEHRVARHRSAAALARRGVPRADNRYHRRHVRDTPGSTVAAGSGRPAGGRHRARANGRATRLDAEALS